jgi:hypothetical protein
MPNRNRAAWNRATTARIRHVIAIAIAVASALVGISAGVSGLLRPSESSGLEPAKAGALFYPFSADPSTVPPTLPHRSVEERELARKVRPLLRFDSTERWRPLEISAFLHERFADGKGHQLPKPDGSGYLDIHGQHDGGAEYFTPVAGHCITAADARKAKSGFNCDRGAPTAMYYRRTEHDRLWFWDYWVFYRFNDYTGKINNCGIYCDDHEGDWEGVTIVTTASLQPQVKGAIIATHQHLVATTASALEVLGDHVAIFVATGTHASYRFPCEGGCDQFRTGLLDVTWPVEESHDGRQDWDGNSDADCQHIDCVRPLPEHEPASASNAPVPIGWNAWKRGWGATCQTGCFGQLKKFKPLSWMAKLHGPSPLAPGQQPRYRCPWAADRIDRGTAPISQIIDHLPSLVVGVSGGKCPVLAPSAPLIPFTDLPLVSD